ncbi:MAG: serine/threonine-protein kinase [Thermoanaerobaculia bacterium]
MNGSSRARFAAAGRHFEAWIELGPAARAAEVAALAATDPELAAAVAALFAADDSAGDFLAAPAGVAARELVSDWVETTEDRAGEVVGAYRLLALLGRGGMGEVWEAERVDGHFEQRVAVKLLKRGVDSDEVLRRFLQERQILARLTHPGIARLFDGGIGPDGRPYFVLEKVDGETILDYARRNRLSIAERVGLLVPVAQAVDAAHRQLVVHRDLKPSNILVTASGEVKLLDFGIAKLLGDGQSEDADASASPAPELTALGLRALTPAYAAPEQILGEPVTTATDVYALGVVLHELLTGRRPHPRASTSAAALAAEVTNETLPRLTSVVRALTADELARLGLPAGESPHLARRLAGDLETILARALDRAPERRYTSAGALADDLQRYLDGRPVEARPDSRWYRARKFARRHRVAVVAAALVALSLIAGLSAALWQARRAAANAAHAEASSRRAERVQGFLIRLFEGSDPDRAQGETITARQLLDEGAARIASELAEEPEVQAALWDAVSQIERRLGRNDVALRLARDALAERRKLLPDSDREVALARLTLGEALFANGDLQAAQAELAAALPVLVASFAEESDEVLRARSAIGGAELQLGDNAAALASSDFVLALTRRKSGADSAETAQALLEHAMALGAADRYAEAEAAAAESVRIFTLRLGANHPRTARARMTWGELLEYVGKRAEAESELETALPVVERTMGEGHPEVGQILLRLGFLDVSTRRYDEAERRFTRALAIFAPLDHYETGTCLRMLGQVAFAREDYRGAEALYQRAVDRFRDKLGADDQLTVTAVGNLGMARVRLGDLASGRELLARAIAGNEKLFGVEADELRVPLLYLGEACRRAGDAAGALVHHRRVLEIALKTIGEAQLGTANARREIALDLLAAAATASGTTARQAALGEARTMLDAALAVVAAIDPEHPRLGEWRLDSARLARAAGDRDRRRRDAADAARRLTTAHGPGYPLTREARALAAG